MPYPLIVRTLFLDETFLQDYDSVHSDNRRQTVRNGNARFIYHSIVQRIADFDFGQ